MNGLFVALVVAQLSARGMDEASAAAASETLTSEGRGTVGPSETTEAEVRKADRQIYQAMLSARTDDLGPLLDDQYSLTHMTGYRQRKREWLEAIDSRQMRYHAAQEKSVTVQVRGDTAVLVNKSVVDATIYGSRGTWNLQLTTDFKRADGKWIALRTVATTF